MALSDIKLLHPKFRGVVRGLQADLTLAYETGRTKTRFELYETFRDPLRQADLFAKGVTKAGPWESLHQFGLAADFVPYLSNEEAIELSHAKGERVMPGWNWDSSHEWDYLTNRAKSFSLVTLDWDRTHVQHSRGYELLKFLKDM